MSETRQLQPYDLVIGDRSFKLRGLSSDCSFEILADDDEGDIHLICAALARAYSLTVAEAETFANDLLHTVAQMRITPPASWPGDGPQRPPQRQQ
jgi:hypothetical protein